VEKGGAFLRPIDKIRLWPVRRAALASRAGLGATRRQACARTARLQDPDPNPGLWATPQANNKKYTI